MTSNQAKAAHRRMIRQRGETVTLRRNDFNTGLVNLSVRAVVTGFAPQELVAGIDQGARKVIVFASDVTFADGIREGDQIILRPGTPEARTLHVESSDNSTRRIAGELIAYQLVATGA